MKPKFYREPQTIKPQKKYAVLITVEDEAKPVLIKQGENELLQIHNFVGKTMQSLCVGKDKLMLANSFSRSKKPQNLVATEYAAGYLDIGGCVYGDALLVGTDKDIAYFSFATAQALADQLNAVRKAMGMGQYDGQTD